MEKDNCISGHRPRTNRFGVTWCTFCGRLFIKTHKPLDRNFLIKENKEYYEKSQLNHV